MRLFSMSSMARDLEQEDGPWRPAPGNDLGRKAGHRIIEKGQGPIKAILFSEKCMRNSEGSLRPQTPQEGKTFSLGLRVKKHNYLPEELF